MIAKEKIKQARAFLGKALFSTAPDLEETLRQTVNLEGQLTRSANNFERHFLTVLTTLEELQAAGETLSKQSSCMLELSQSEENPINSVSRKLAPNLNFIETSAHSIDSLIKILDTNRKKIDTTLAFESKLDQTFSQLTYIRTLFAVEAAPLEQNAKVMFTSLVEEIHRLQKDVTQIFAENFQALRENRGTIGNLAKSLSEQTSTQLSTHSVSQREMDAAIQTQTEILTSDITANSDLKRQSETISQSIGSAIISLQTQDIVSQKMQHIFEVSQEMRNRFGQLPNIKDKRKRCVEYRFLENAALVILNQIDSIKRELQDADQSVNNSIHEITTSIQKMEETSTLMEASHSSKTDSAQGECLIEALRNAGEMVQTSHSFLEQAFSTIEPIRNQTTNVSSTITRLSSQLHLIGLNAEIHAARTGGSTALETLSAKTSGISVETRDLCQNISAQLDELSGALLENVNVLESLLDEANQARRQISEDIPRETENLQHQNNLYNKCQTETQELMEQLRQLTQTQESRLDFEATMLKELEALQSLHSEISAQAKHAADRTKVDVNVPEIMSGLLARYTMNSEKSIHMQTLGLKAEDDPEPPPFSENSVESFGFQPDDRQTTQSESKKEEELGQNVEFF